MRKATTLNQNREVTTSSSVTTVMLLRTKIRKETRMETHSQLELQRKAKVKVTVTKYTTLTCHILTTMLAQVNGLSDVTPVEKTLIRSRRCRDTGDSTQVRSHTRAKRAGKTSDMTAC